MTRYYRTYANQSEFSEGETGLIAFTAVFSNANDAKKVHWLQFHRDYVQGGRKEIPFVSAVKYNKTFYGARQNRVVRRRGPGERRRISAVVRCWWGPHA